MYRESRVAANQMKFSRIWTGCVSSDACIHYYYTTATAEQKEEEEEDPYFTIPTNDGHRPSPWTSQTAILGMVLINTLPLHTVHSQWLGAHSIRRVVHTISTFDENSFSCPLYNYYVFYDSLCTISILRINRDACVWAVSRIRTRMNGCLALCAVSIASTINADTQTHAVPLQKTTI